MVNPNSNGFGFPNRVQNLNFCGRPRVELSSHVNFCQIYSLAIGQYPIDPCGFEIADALKSCLEPEKY